MSSYLTRNTPGDTSWFVHDRFGMFIHFGVYAMPARHEWARTNEKMPDAEYDKYLRFLDPDLFDARQWARTAKKAGMRYAVLTTKHHDGFCLFDSAYTDYKSTNTPFGRDIVREYVDAFRAEGLRVGLYYSLLDWHHPDYTIDWYHPHRDDPDAEQQNQTRNWDNYVRYMYNQVEELMSGYGKIDLLWFDFTYPGIPEDAKSWMQLKGAEEWHARELIKMVRRLQPEIVINNRTGLEQDLFTPEQCQTAQWPRHPQTGELVTWESCQTFSGSWGYCRDETTWKNPLMLIQMLIDTVSLGGNLIMNVGPTGRGNFDDRAMQALHEFERWMKYNSRSIYGCTMAEPEFKEPRGCRLTQSQDGKRLYIHVLEYPFESLEVEGLDGKIEYVQFLHDASEIPVLRNDHIVAGTRHLIAPGNVRFKLPVLKPDVLVPVLEVFLKD